VYSGADGSALYELNSPNAQFNGFFVAVAGLDDVDGDGRGDLAVGAGGESPEVNPGPFIGQAYVFSGAPEGTAGDETPALAGALAVSPNPVRGAARVRLSVEAAQSVTVTVFDVTGRRVATLFDGAVGAGQSLDLGLDAARLPAGVYAVRATGTSIDATQRVTVVR